MTDRVSKGDKLVIVLVMMAGFFGLSYEILFTRTLTTLFGSIFYVSAGVMAAFFIGIGISSFFAQKHYRLAGKIEITIGAIGILFGLSYKMAVEHSDVFFKLMPESSFMVLAIPFVITLLPSLVIGCSLPMLYELFQRKRGVGETFPKVFSAYNFGALVCVLIIEVVLVRFYGISSTLLALGTVNLLVGFHLNKICKNEPVAEKTDESFKSLVDKTPGNVILALLVSSVAFGMFQILGLKLMSHVWGATASNVAAVIGSALIGSALGAWLFSKFKVKLSTVLLLSIPAATMGVLMIEPVSWLWSRIALDINEIVGPYWTFLMQSIMVFVLLVPAYIFIGPTESVAKDSSKERGAAGLFIGITSIGNAIGIVVFTLFVHGTFMDHVSFILIASLIAVSTFIAMKGEDNVSKV